MIGVRIARGVLGAASDAAGRVALSGLDVVLGWRYTDEAVRRVLASRAADHAVVEVADVVTEREVLEHALERVLAQRIDTRLIDTVVERLLESEELWRVVDVIASSPAVTAAIGSQGAGLADEVADQVRVRSQHGDAALERAARRLLRRRPA
jgi:hypothetical protein